jgi:uncharacterized membrane protein YhaH (DUF805 family)
MEARMNFTDAVSKVYRNYVNFSGRARRSEYWWWALYMLITGSVIALIESSLGLGMGHMGMGGGSMSAGYEGGPLTGIWSLAHLLPGLGVAVRRLHDTERSGWWLLIVLIPVIGLLALLYFFVIKGTSGQNRFGEDPIR